MSGDALLTGLLAALAVLLSRPSRRARAARLPPAARRPTGVGRPGALRGPPAARLLAALLAGAGVALVLGGPAGVLLGAGTVPALVVVLGRLEPPGARRRRERLRADLPHAVDLLAACLAAGRPPGPAVEQVGAAVGGPLADDLAVSTARLRLGSDPVAVWRELGRHPELGPLGRALARAAESGASVAGAISRLAEDLRVEARAEVESRARAVGVRAAIPLGVCLLPAFVLVGVVPLVAGSFGELLGP